MQEWMWWCAALAYLAVSVVMAGVFGERDPRMPDAILDALFWPVVALLYIGAALYGIGLRIGRWIGL